ncbi:MAG: hypothetical protein WDO13_02995 [Verrucomicrobiota bacterium]
MGAKIEGHGTRRIEITGVGALGGCEHNVIPDRIEAGTYMVGALITQGDVLLNGADADHLVNVIDRMKSCGAHSQVRHTGIHVSATRKLQLHRPRHGEPTPASRPTCRRRCARS